MVMILKQTSNLFGTFHHITMEVNETFMLFFTFGKWKKIHHVPYVCTQYSLQETVISTKNHQKWLIFRFLELLKIHKSSFKDSLKLVFHQNTSKTVQKVKIWTNIQKSPSRFFHPLRLLCRVRQLTGSISMRLQFEDDWWSRHKFGFQLFSVLLRPLWFVEAVFRRESRYLLQFLQKCEMHILTLILYRPLRQFRHCVRVPL